MPEVVVKGVEVKDPVGPYGAKGVGEIGLVPTAGAVANAFSYFNKTRIFNNNNKI
jgi:xanthine dehydrogenase molybdenum-binding subunit